MNVWGWSITMRQGTCHIATDHWHLIQKWPFDKTIFDHCTAAHISIFLHEPRRIKHLDSVAGLTVEAGRFITNPQFVLHESIEAAMLLGCLQGRKGCRAAKPSRVLNQESRRTWATWQSHGKQIQFWRNNLSEQDRKLSTQMFLNSSTTKTEKSKHRCS